MEKFHQEISSMKSVFKSNGYPKNFIDNKVILTVPKLQLVCMLPYTSKPSLDLRARLRCAIDRNIPFCKLNFIFRSTCRVGKLFRFKHFLEKRYQKYH